MSRHKVSKEVGEEGKHLEVFGVETVTHGSHGVHLKNLTFMALSAKKVPDP